VDGRRVVAWRFGRGPTVVLLHGWGGRAAQLSSFIGPLVARGFGVIALDAPGHGASARGRSSAPQFARALQAVVPEGAFAVVAHSLGAAAAALALRDGMRVARLVFLAPPAYPPAWFDVYAQRLGLGSALQARIVALSERRLRLRWTDLHVPALAASLEAPLLVIHDRLDRDVPLEDGRAVAAAWRGSRLVETTGLGHVALLRDPGAVSEAVDFIAAEGAPECTCGRTEAEGGEGGCERCLFERELFDRDARFASWASARAS
jgi:pimeloyl-ACP methyl ester carboxylesterase